MNTKKCVIGVKNKIKIKGVKAVIFDLDNTLIDFMRMKRESCSAAVEAMINAGLKMRKEDAMKVLFDLYNKYGLEYDKIFQKFLEKTIKRIDYRILAEGVVAYRKMQTGYVKPYSSVVPTLIKLKAKGLKLGIISDAPAVKAWLRLVEMKISDFFDVVVTLDDTGEKKPSKKPFEIALKRLRMKPSDVVYVGDRPERDIKGAKSLGIKTVFARYGCENPPKFSGADFEINDIKDLLKII